MGHYPSAELVIGFLIEEETFRNAFAIVKPEGVPARSRPGWYEDKDGVEKSLMLGGKCAELDDVIADLEGSIGCVIRPHGDMVSGEGMTLSITPKEFKKQAYSLHEAYSFGGECERIRERFKEYGLDLGEPRVQAAWSYE